MFLGLIGRKLGMSQVFREDGSVEVVTALEAGPCFVSQVKTETKDGYKAIQIGFGEVKRLNSPARGHLKRVGHLLKYLGEFRADNLDSIQVGQKIEVDVFKAGDIVDVTGTSKGKGFAGVVKRHHFAGGPKTHGQSDRHRAPGSIGATTFPGRVLKGTRMAGHLGDRRVTVKNLEVVKADLDRNLLLVRGAVPGSRGGILTIKKRQGK
jgi:large subunit ribosomal protein L3